MYVFEYPFFLYYIYPSIIIYLYFILFIFLFQQCNDFGLMTYLGIITKGCNNINQFVNKFNILYDRQGVGRRLRSLFF